MSVVFVMKIRKKRKFDIEYLYYYYIKVIIWKVKGSIEKISCKSFFYE